MSCNTVTSPGVHDATPVDKTAFAAFDIRKVNTETFSAAVTTARGALVYVLFWDVDCFNYKIAKKAILVQSGTMRELKLKWLHASVYAHSELGQRFVLRDIPVFMFFHRGKKLSRTTS